MLTLSLYSYNLKKNLLFSHDTARDTARLLEIWQKKELTLIGPPVSFGQLGNRQVFFSSLAMYIGLVGLVLSGFSVIGPILPNIFFLIVSVPFFYLLLKELGFSKRLSLITALLYVLSPVTVTYVRFFWNPNLIVPFSVFFWYFILKKYSTVKKQVGGFFLAGLIGGLIVNLHYFSMFPIIFYLVFLLFQKKSRLVLFFTAGLIIGCLPLIFFELKHHFYLTSSLFFNLKQASQSQTTFTFHIENFFDAFYTVVGLKPTEIINRVIQIKLRWFFGVFSLILSYLILSSLKQAGRRIILVLVIFFTIVITIKLTGGLVFQIHYLFPIYPLLIWYIGLLLSSVKQYFFYLVLLIPILIADFYILTDSQSLKRDYLSVAKIEAITRTIIKDRPVSPYNISENIGGGAQAIPFRFFLNRDATIKPNNIQSYTNLNTLYVVSPSLALTKKENRWEFYATANLTLTKTVDFGEVKLFKFEAGR